MCLRHIISAQVRFPPASPQTDRPLSWRRPHSVFFLPTPPSSLSRPLHLCFWMFGNRRTLFGNKIKSVAKRAFSGLEGLEHL